MNGDNSESDLSDGIVDMQIVECSETEEKDLLCSVPTQNRFVSEQSGRGDDWKQVRKKRKKVSSTDSIDTETFDKLPNSGKLTCLFQTLTENSETLGHIKREQSRFHRETIEMKENMARLNMRTDRVERKIDHQARFMKTLAYRSIDTEARSRRNNIIIWGVTENTNMSTENLVFGFIEDELDIDTTHIVIDRTHRIGSEQSRYRQDPKRPIIVRFRDYGDSEIVMKRAYKLRGTPFGLDRDYPMEIANARKELYKREDAQKARAERKKVQIRYPAKLFIEGRLIKDKFPEWNQLLREDRTSFFEDGMRQHVEDDIHTGTMRNQGESSNEDKDDSDSCEIANSENVFHKVKSVNKASESEIERSTQQTNTKHQSSTQPISTKTRDQQNTQNKNVNLPATRETSRQRGASNTRVIKSTKQDKHSSQNPQNSNSKNNHNRVNVNDDNLANSGSAEPQVTDRSKNRLRDKPENESRAKNSTPVNDSTRSGDTNINDL